MILILLIRQFEHRQIVNLSINQIEHDPSKYFLLKKLAFNPSLPESKLEQQIGIYIASNNFLLNYAKLEVFHRQVIPYLGVKIKMQIYHIAIVVQVFVSDLPFFCLEVAECALGLFGWYITKISPCLPFIISESFLWRRGRYYEVKVIFVIKIEAGWYFIV